jgi:hypothetical protein
MQRRTFFRLAGLGTPAALGAPWIGNARAAAASPGCVTEPAREVPLAGTADVVVCGAGPAGVAAALGAARQGAKTLLLETHGCLGGIWTAGALTWILDHTNKTGIMQEIWQGLERRGARGLTRKGGGTNAADTEAMKLLLEELCASAGVQIQLHTRVCAAAKTSDQRLTHVITESKSGREAFAGKVFIDCTGDGDLAAQAGCGWDMGYGQQGVTQPMSLIALVAGITVTEAGPFVRTEDLPMSQSKTNLRAEIKRGGHVSSYGGPSLFPVREDLFIAMLNEEHGFKGTRARDVTAATLHARQELHTMLDGLRALGGVWKNVRLVATAEQIGVREGRRIHGLYTITDADLREGRRHPDAVCRATFGIDIHTIDPVEGNKAVGKIGYRAKPYDIPLRALIARDVQGLMMAGRCISGDFIAHSSYRVTGDAVAMGESAGRVAARAAQTGRLPQQVALEELKT